MGYLLQLLTLMNEITWLRYFSMTKKDNFHCYDVTQSLQIGSFLIFVKKLLADELPTQGFTVSISKESTSSYWKLAT